VVDDVSDWNVGDTIVIASTNHDDGTIGESEVHRILTIVDTGAIAGTGPWRITLGSVTGPPGLLHMHYGATDTYLFGLNTASTTLAAEVGLLTRSIVVQGADTLPGGSAEEYGAHIMLHSLEGDDETTIGRIEHVELRYAGQAFMKGRYPINFHQLGFFHDSYVRGNAIWATYNRAIAIHGARNLRVQDNVIYDVMGHAVFIEDGRSAKNLIENNLVVSVQASFSLLQSD
jgi:cell migration-inducing and hyaluronan-binding protein